MRAYHLLILMKNLYLAVGLLFSLFALTQGITSATGTMFTKVEKFSTYNHPDMRTCIISFHMLYNPITASNTKPTAKDNGTVPLSMHFEVMGKEELLQCTVWDNSNTHSWNSQACVLTNIKATSVKDAWDASFTDVEMSSVTAAAVDGTDCDIAGSISTCYTRRS